MKLRVYAETGYVGCDPEDTYEFAEEEVEELKEMTAAERDEYCTEIAEEMFSQLVTWGWTLEEEDTDE